jgi:hypothetical protein
LARPGGQKPKTRKQTTTERLSVRPLSVALVYITKTVRVDLDELLQGARAVLLLLLLTFHSPWSSSLRSGTSAWPTSVRYCASATSSRSVARLRWAWDGSH